MQRLIWIGVVLAASLSQLSAVNEFVEITSRRANIRSQPRTSSGIVTTAHRGDVFSVRGEERDWYEIHILSGGKRYVHKSLARRVVHAPQLPASIGTRREIFQSFQQMESRIHREANARYPPEQRLEQNIELGQRLRDQYGLELMHRFDITTPVYKKIVIEGIQSNW